MQNLLEEAEQIQKYLEIDCSDNVPEIKERINTLSVYLARSGNMLAEAKRIYRRKVTSEIANTIIAIAKENCLSAKAQNALVDSIAEDEAFLVDKLDRINSSCVHQIDALRSLLSFEKEQLRTLNYQLNEKLIFKYRHIRKLRAKDSGREINPNRERDNRKL